MEVIVRGAGMVGKWYSMWDNTTHTFKYNFDDYKFIVNSFL